MAKSSPVRGVLTRSSHNSHRYEETGSVDSHSACSSQPDRGNHQHTLLHLKQLIDDPNARAAVQKDTPIKVTRRTFFPVCCSDTARVLHSRTKSFERGYVDYLVTW